MMKFQSVKLEEKKDYEEINDSYLDNDNEDCDNWSDEENDKMEQSNKINLNLNTNRINDKFIKKYTHKSKIDDSDSDTDDYNLLSGSGINITYRNIFLNKFININ